jgi:putative spermidine/putrescine transport system substrate-binding protein
MNVKVDRPWRGRGWRAVHWLTAALAGALVLACGGSGTSTASPTPRASVAHESKLVFAGPGGATGTIFKQILNDWGARNGVAVTYVEGTSASNLAKIQAQAKAGHPEIDIYDANDQSVALGRVQGLWAKLDMSIVTNARDMAPAYAFPKDVVGSPAQGVMMQVLPTVIAYNKDVFTRNGWGAPTSWKDLYSPKYAGCVIPLSPQSGVPYIPWLNYLTTKDYGNANQTIADFKKIASKVPSFSDSNPAALQLVAQGVGCMTPSSQGRALEAARTGPIGTVYPKDGSPYFLGGLAITKNGPDPLAAQMALNEFISAGAQQKILLNAYYPTTNLKVAKPSSGLASEVTFAADFKKVPGGLHPIPLATYNNLDDWVRQWSAMASSR